MRAADGVSYVDRSRWLNRAIRVQPRLRFLRSHSKPILKVAEKQFSFSFRPTFDVTVPVYEHVDEFRSIRATRVNVGRR